MKKISLLILTLIATAFIAGCAAQEPEPEVPVGKPGDGGPQPTSVSGAAGGTQAAQTE